MLASGRLLLRTGERSECGQETSVAGPVHPVLLCGIGSSSSSSYSSTTTITTTTSTVSPYGEATTTVSVPTGRPRSSLSPRRDHHHHCPHGETTFAATSVSVWCVLVRSL